MVFREVKHGGILDCKLHVSCYPDWWFSISRLQYSVAKYYLLLGTVAKTDDKAHEVSAVSNGSSVEEPKSQEMPQHDVVAINSGHHTDDHHMSNLELENTLLRKEVASLNEEMVSVVQRAKEAEKSKYQSYCTMKEQNPNLP